MLRAAGEPAPLCHLPPAVGHGLPAAAANATPRQRPAAVPHAAKHQHGHVQGETGPGGPGALSSGRRAGDGRR